MNLTEIKAWAEIATLPAFCFVVWMEQRGIRKEIKDGFAAMQEKLDALILAVFSRDRESVK